MDETSCDALIAQLNLAPHPEGGWYRETWRAPPDATGRARGTAILFLLRAGERSHWHRVDADELWFWHSGAPLLLSRAAAEGADTDEIRLGGDPLSGYAAQALIPAGYWQAAVADRGWALVSCVVVPGFDFSGFELAPPGWSPEPHLST